MACSSKYWKPEDSGGGDAETRGRAGGRDTRRRALGRAALAPSSSNAERSTSKRAFRALTRLPEGGAAGDSQDAILALPSAHTHTHTRDTRDTRDTRMRAHRPRPPPPIAHANAHTCLDSPCPAQQTHGAGFTGTWRLRNRGRLGPDFFAVGADTVLTVVQQCRCRRDPPCGRSRVTQVLGGKPSPLGRSPLGAPDTLKNSPLSGSNATSFTASPAEHPTKMIQILIWYDE